MLARPAIAPKLADNSYTAPATTPLPPPPTAPHPHCSLSRSPPSAPDRPPTAVPLHREPHRSPASAPGMQLPPARRHLDQQAPIPQEVVHLAVGVAGQAGVGRKPTRSGFRRTHKLQQDGHTSWPQILGQLADPPTHNRCCQGGHTAQAATGGYLQTALLELREICVDIKLIAVGYA
jgi:hypothetical protein